jgi:DNA-binding SARP family transcriptional activator
VEFRVLGSLEVVRPEGALELPGAKERAVLAYLLSHLGRSVSAGEIIDAVWGERPPASAERSLQVRISQLRRLLEPGRIERDGVGYRLAVGTDDVDAERFARLVVQAGGLEPAQTLAQADEALALWRGEPYGEFSDPTSRSRRIGA